MSTLDPQPEDLDPSHVLPQVMWDQVVAARGAAQAPPVPLTAAELDAIDAEVTP